MWFVCVVTTPDANICRIINLLQRIGSLMTCTTPSTLFSGVSSKTRKASRAELDFGLVERLGDSSEWTLTEPLAPFDLPREGRPSRAVEEGGCAGEREADEDRDSLNRRSSEKVAMRRSTSELRSFTIPIESILNGGYENEKPADCIINPSPFILLVLGVQAFHARLVRCTAYIEVYDEFITRA